MKLQNSLRRLSAALCLAAAGFAVSGNTARAVDVVPCGYCIAPKGTTITQLYLTYNTADKYDSRLYGEIPDSKLKTASAVFRYVYYGAFSNSAPWMFNLVGGAANIEEARVGGVDRPTASGLTDTTLIFAFWPLNPENKKTGLQLGFGSYLDMPTGAYDEDKVSLGTGTWTFTQQVGFVQGMTNGFYIEGAADVAWQFDNETSNGTTSRDPAYHVQAWLRKELPGRSMVAVGYGRKTGGKGYLDGVFTGTQTDASAIRVAASKALTDNIQIYGAYKYDLKVKGGFEGQSFQLRISKLF